MTKRVIIAFVSIVLCSLHGYSQSASKLYKKVKEANRSISDFGDSTFFIQYTSTLRFTKAKSHHSGAFLFYSKNEPYSFFGSAYGSNLLFEGNDIRRIYMSGDTTEKIHMKPYHFDQYHSRSEYFMLTHILTTNKGDFSRKRFRKPKVTYHQNDTFAITQIDKKWKSFRTIYFTNDYRIFKYETFNNDSDRPDSSFTFQINYFKYNCYDSICKEYELGTYRLPFEPIVEKFTDSLTTDNHDTIPLINGSVATNFGGKFILLDYWYLGCSPCLQMMPFMNELHAKIDTSQLLIIGVNPYDNKEHIHNYLQKRGFEIAQMDAQQIKPFHDLNTHPTLILVDANLKEVKRFVGYGKGASDREIRRYLKSLDLLN